MKKIILLSSLLTVAISLRAAHVQFQFENGTSDAVTNRGFLIYPLSMPSLDGLIIVGRKPILTNTGSGTIIVSNMQAGTWECLVDTEYTKTPFRITIPSTNALINAAAYISVATNISPASVAYSMASADARFVLRNSGISSNQTAYGITSPGTGGVGAAAWGGSATAPFTTTVSGTASGTNSTSEGYASAVTATDATGFGAFIEGDGQGSTILGTSSGSDLAAPFSVVMGSYSAALAGASNSVIVGANLSSGVANQVLLGGSGHNVSVPGTLTVSRPTTLAAVITTNVPLKVSTAPSGTTNALEVYNGPIFLASVDPVRGEWLTTNDFRVIGFTTSDNTTNTALTVTPRNNSAVRIDARAIAWNSTATASYGRIGTFKNNAGTVTQVGAVSALGIAEEDSIYECLLDTSANTIRVRVAGNTGRTVKWNVYVHFDYSE